MINNSRLAASARALVAEAKPLANIGLGRRYVVSEKRMCELKAAIEAIKETTGDKA